MMDISTPICDFVNKYVDSEPLRLHMPGHKGKAALRNVARENENDSGMAAETALENLDITEIDGADILYHAQGIIRESESNASRIFGTARTIYSTEGSSLCIRAMLYLLQLYVNSYEYMNYSYRQYQDKDNTAADIKGNVNKNPYINEKANAKAALAGAACAGQLSEGSIDHNIRSSYQMHTGRRVVIAAGRNAHKTFITCAGLLDMDVRWMYSHESSLVSCKLSPQEVEEFIEQEHPDAVYITSPDYLGNIPDIAGISEVCHKHGCLLIVDNAHGAYLKFIASSAAGHETGIISDSLSRTEAECSNETLVSASANKKPAGHCMESDNESCAASHKPGSMHPIDLGADICCDSAHKTLPVLTGGAYLHIADRAPELLRREAERAMSMFATTSPSYVIMQSLDRANYIMSINRRQHEDICKHITSCDDETSGIRTLGAENISAGRNNGDTGKMPESNLAEVKTDSEHSDYAFQISISADRLKTLKAKLEAAGWELAGDEPLKLCICPKSYGYTGSRLAEILKENGIYIEFYDPDYAVMMFTPSISEEDFAKLEQVLHGIRRQEAIEELPPSPAPGVPGMSIQEALFSQCEDISIDKAEGRILAEPGVTCPPAVPIAICGEIIDRNAIECFRYYSIDTVKVVV